MSDAQRHNLAELVTALAAPSNDPDAPPAVSEDMRALLDRGLHHVFLPDTLKTRAAESFHLAFEAIGGLPRLAMWADKNPTKFFQLYARQILPTMAPVLPQHTVAAQVWPEWLTDRRLAYQEEKRISEDISGASSPDTDGDSA